MSKKQNIPPAENYAVYGRAATSMGRNGFQGKFGKSNTKAGAKGERILAEKLRDKWLPKEVPLFCSLIVPGKSSDIDFAVVQGNKILLIDAKMYRQDGGFFWNWGASPSIKRNLSAYTTGRNNNPVTMSKSMSMARDVISRKMPGYVVESIVVLTTDHNNRNAKQPNTMFLTYPGGVKALNDSAARRYIKRFFRGQKRTAKTYSAEQFLKKITQ